MAGPIRLYTYPDSVLDGLPDAPEPLLRIDIPGDGVLFEHISDPADADFILFPFVLDAVFYRVWGSSNWRDEDWAAAVAFLRRLPLFAAKEARHIFVIHHDHDVRFGLSSVFFRASLSRTWKDDHAFAIPHPVTGVEPAFDKPPAYLTSFVGAGNTAVVRDRLLSSREQFSILPHFIEVTPYFYGGFDGEMAQKLRTLFLLSVQRSVTVLCPRGSGRNSIRFFECLAAGSLPVLLSDDAALPYEDVIPYDRLVVRVPEADAARTVHYIVAFLQNKTADDIWDLRRTAREVFDRYLAPGVQPAQWFRILKRQLTA